MTNDYDDELMLGKVVMITGANSGIGYETALGLAKMGARIIMVCRNRERAEEALETLKIESKSDRFELYLADLANQNSVREMVREFKKSHSRLDVLINNAGLMMTKRHLTPEGNEMTLAINHLGHFLLTNLLLDLLLASAPSRIINVSSVAHKFANLDLDNLNLEGNFNGLLAYGNSKLANILFTYELARRLEGTGVDVNVLHPGTIRTNLGKRFETKWFKYFFAFLKLFMKGVKKGAKTPIYLASSAEVEGMTGNYFVNKKIKKTSKRSQDIELQQEFWNISEQLTGIGIDHLDNLDLAEQPVEEKHVMPI